METDDGREDWAVLAEFAKLPVDLATLSVDSDLYRAGLTSHASVNVMLALEDAFDVEFPQQMLRKKTFESVAAVTEALTELLSTTSAYVIITETYLAADDGAPGEEPGQGMVQRMSTIGASVVADSAADVDRTGVSRSKPSRRCEPKSSCRCSCRVSSGARRGPLVGRRRSGSGVEVLCIHRNDLRDAPDSGGLPRATRADTHLHDLSSRRRGGPTGLARLGHDRARGGRRCSHQSVRGRGGRRPLQPAQAGSVISYGQYATQCWRRRAGTPTPHRATS